MPAPSPEVACIAITPDGLISPKRSIMSQFDIDHTQPQASTYFGWGKRRQDEPLASLSRELTWMESHQRLLAAWRAPNEAELTAYTVPLVDCFHEAAKVYPGVRVDPSVMAGAPCVEGTRIPIYMILDAIEHAGSVNAALESYPRLNLQQVRDAIGFAKLVVECPIDEPA